MRHTKHIILAAAFAAVLALASCDRRPLWYEYGPLAGIDLVPNWEKAGGVPDRCTTFIYDENGRFVTSINSTKTDVIHFELPVGSYRAATVTYSEDNYQAVEFIEKETFPRFRVRSIDDFTEWTVDGAKKAIGREPEWIAVGFTDVFKITTDDVETSLIPFEEWRDGTLNEHSPGYEISTTRTINEDIYNLVSDLEVEVWVDDIRKVHSARAVMGGMAAGMDIPAEGPLADTLAVSLERWEPWNEYTYAVGKLTAHVNCFGRPILNRDFVAEDNPFDLYLSLGNGSVFRYFAKVGHLIVDNADETWAFRRKLRLQIGSPEDPIILPEMDSETLGFNVWVDEWVDGGKAIVEVIGTN